MCDVYAILDPARVPDAERWVRDVIAGGAKRVQLRAKSLGAGATLALARSMGRLCADANVELVVNDRPDVALLAGAGAVHLGQDDLPAEHVIRAMPGLAVDVSTHTLAQLRAAVSAGARAVAYGPVFPTASKEQPDAVVGVEGLARAVRESRVPVIAIGGIDATNIGAVARTGAAYAAVIGALVPDADRVERTRALVAAARTPDAHGSNGAPS